MSDILSPVANLPLTTSPRGVRILNVKGCPFIDGLRLDPGRFYLMFFSTEDRVPLPPAGFYEIADNKKVIYIKEFRPYMRSEYRTITISTISGPTLNMLCRHYRRSIEVR